MLYNLHEKVLGGSFFQSIYTEQPLVSVTEPHSEQL